MKQNFVVVLFKVLVHEQNHLKRRRVGAGSQFEDAVHCSGDVKAEGLEEIGHIGSSVKKQGEMEAGAWFTCSLFSPGPQPTSLKSPWELPQIPAQGFVS